MHRAPLFQHSVYQQLWKARRGYFLECIFVIVYVCMCVFPTVCVTVCLAWGSRIRWSCLGPLGPPTLAPGHINMAQGPSLWHSYNKVILPVSQVAHGHNIQRGVQQHNLMNTVIILCLAAMSQWGGCGGSDDFRNREMLPTASSRFM